MSEVIKKGKKKAKIKTNNKRVCHKIIAKKWRLNGFVALR